MLRASRDRPPALLDLGIHHLDIGIGMQGCVKLRVSHQMRVSLFPCVNSQRRACLSDTSAVREGQFQFRLTSPSILVFLLEKLHVDIAKEGLGEERTSGSVINRKGREEDEAVHTV